MMPQRRSLSRERARHLRGPLSRRRFAVCALFAALAARCAIASEPRDESATEQRDIQAVYDTTYADVYDLLWLDQHKYKWEVDEIAAAIRIPSSEVRILDSGCGTGTHYLDLSKSYQVVGLDISAAMIRVAREKNPSGQFIVGDMKDRSLFERASFSHIISMYEATFYNREVTTIVANYRYWLRDGGVLMLETIDPEKLARSVNSDHPPRYRRQSEHMTKEAWWKLPGTDDVAVYHEELRFRDGREVTKEHVLYLPKLSTFEHVASEQGFRLSEKKASPFFPQEVLYIFEKRVSTP